MRTVRAGFWVLVGVALVMGAVTLAWGQHPQQPNTLGGWGPGLLTPPPPPRHVPLSEPVTPINPPRPDPYPSSPVPEFHWQNPRPPYGSVTCYRINGVLTCLGP